MAISAKFRLIFDPFGDVMTFSPEQVSGAIAFAASVPPKSSLNLFLRLLLESDVALDMLYMSPEETKSSNAQELFSEKVAAAVFSDNVSPPESAATNEFKESLKNNPSIQQQLSKEIQSLLN